MSDTNLVLLIAELDELLSQSELIEQYAPLLFNAAAFADNPHQHQSSWLPSLGDSAPQAAYAYCQDIADAGSQYWVRADPVVMYADISRVHLLGISGYELTEQQTDALLHDLQTLLNDEGLALSRGAYPNAHEHWYIGSDAEMPTAFSSPITALGQPLEDYLGPAQSSADNAMWRRLQSESQMLLHQHPVNIEREQQGLPALSSLWFWGTGRLPSKKPALLPDAVWASRTELAGWSRWAGVNLISYQSQQPLADWLTNNLKAQSQRLLIEFSIQRQMSFEQNLILLNDWLALFLSSTGLSSITLHIDREHGLPLKEPNRWQRLTHSQTKSHRRGLNHLQGLVK